MSETSVLVLMIVALLCVASRPVLAGSSTVAASFATRFAAAQDTAATASGAPPDERAVVKDGSADRDARDDTGPQSDRPPPAASPPGRDSPAPAVPPSKLRGPSAYRDLIEKEAARAGLPAEIAEAVMAVESGYNAGAIGAVGEIGLMQIRPATARMLGFTGSDAALAVPETNIHYGVTYLGQAWRLAGADLCTAVMKYRAGHGETRFSFLSVNYCLAVRSRLLARGFRVTGQVPVATFGDPRGATACRRGCLAGSSVGRVDLAALNSRLGALVTQLRPLR
ncbi:MAG TPA: transglycosylase SLT domain-containing protein [Bradyrhizobium sp.]|nr:transglycosylase SLT domain-containing protein [Bradyrhizobium sp.]